LGEEKLKVKPGIYYGVPFEEYCQWDAVNNSSLDPILFQSPAHYQAKLNEPPKKTNALAFGSLAHTAMLEPDEFKRNYIGVPEGEFTKGCMLKDGVTPSSSPKSTSQYKQNKINWYLETPRLVLKKKKQEFEKLREKMSLPEQIEWLHSSAKKTMIEFEDFEKISKLCDELKTHPLYEKLRNGKKEVSFAWKDADTGILCTGRVDSLCPYLIADFKTTETTVEWEWSFWKWNYYRQGPMYQDGLATLGHAGGELLPFWLCVAQKTSPFDCVIAPAHELDLQQGRAEYKMALERIMRCRRDKEWPGVPDPEYWRIPEKHREYQIAGTTVKG